MRSRYSRSFPVVGSKTALMVAVQMALLEYRFGVMMVRPLEVIVGALVGCVDGGDVGEGWRGVDGTLGSVEVGGIRTIVVGGGGTLGS
mmetsp:Transcript_15264/g.18581  ORF Transcript_15264/g.18581 Transcript_15264/m.18581 type:complete len:88 (+) Transcript_15264:88-351(+)